MARRVGLRQRLRHPLEKCKGILRSGVDKPIAGEKTERMAGRQIALEAKSQPRLKYVGTDQTVLQNLPRFIRIGCRGCQRTIASQRLRLQAETVVPGLRGDRQRPVEEATGRLAR